VIRAVIFDFYGTLARWADGTPSYAGVFADHGYTPDATVLDGYFSRYNGIEHGEHSVNEEAYEVWVRSRLRQLTRDGGVDDKDAESVVDALRRLDEGEMVAYPEAAATLGALREAGLTVGVCSNWGWELDAYLDQVGLLALVDSSVTSARAGARKPHPNIYRTSVASLGVSAGDVVFVGDSWEPDVRGPRQLGMTAVHVWREEERRGFDAPELEDGDRRVGDLSGVLEIVGLS
jgi:putative hydrolase of the HAD superfamily